MKTARNHHRTRELPTTPRPVAMPASMNDELLNRRLREMMLDDEWNSPCDEPLTFDDRTYKTVDGE